MAMILISFLEQYYDIWTVAVARGRTMDGLLIAVALEYALQQLRVHEGSTELRLSRCKPADKRGKQYEKLVRDRVMARNVLSRTLTGIAESGKWNSLQNATALLEQRILTTMAKRREYEDLRLSKIRIKIEMDSKQEEWTDRLLKADQKIALLRDQKQNDLLNATIRLRYAEMWLCARAEAQELRYRMQSKPAPTPSAEHEKRIHEEIIKALTLQIDEREKGIEHWEKRYKEDTVDITQRLTKQRQQLVIITAKREELQQLYNLHEGEMRSWLSFKEQRAARLARQEKIRLSATRIQAWWRGLMVQRALGCFKYLRNLKKSPAKSKQK